MTAPLPTPEARWAEWSGKHLVNMDPGKTVPVNLPLQATPPVPPRNPGFTYHSSGRTDEGSPFTGISRGVAAPTRRINWSLPDLEELLLEQARHIYPSTSRYDLRRVGESVRAAQGTAGRYNVTQTPASSQLRAQDRWTPPPLKLQGPAEGVLVTEWCSPADTHRAQVHELTVEMEEDWKRAWRAAHGGTNPRAEDQFDIRPIDMA